MLGSDSHILRSQLSDGGDIKSFLFVGSSSIPDSGFSSMGRHFEQHGCIQHKLRNSHQHTQTGKHIIIRHFGGQLSVIHLVQLQRMTMATFEPSTIATHSKNTSPPPKSFFCNQRILKYFQLLFSNYIDTWDNYWNSSTSFNHIN